MAGPDTNLASGKVKRTAGNVTTTSSTFSDITGLTVTLTTGARRCLVSWTFNCLVTNASDQVDFDVAVDGTGQGGATRGLFYVRMENAGSPNQALANGTYITDVLSAGSHTIKMQFRSVNNTSTATVYASDPPATFAVAELSNS